MPWHPRTVKEGVRPTTPQAEKGQNEWGLLTAMAPLGLEALDEPFAGELGTVVSSSFRKFCSDHAKGGDASFLCPDWWAYGDVV